MLPIDWQWVTHPRLIFLRSQCFIQAATMLWGNDKNEVESLCCRRGLLAYVYNGVSLITSVLKCLSGGKVALIYYGSVAMTFTVQQKQHGFYIVLGHHMVFVHMWTKCGYHIDTTWFLSGYHLVSMWIPCGFHVHNMWFPGGQQMDSNVDTT